MMPAEAERMNARYSEFYLTRYSPKTGRILLVGRPRRTIQEALDAAAKIDNRNRSRRLHMTFIDVVRPK